MILTSRKKSGRRTDQRPKMREKEAHVSPSSDKTEGGGRGYERGCIKRPGKGKKASDRSRGEKGVE